MLIRNRKLNAAFSAAACQHFPAIGRLHAFPETVNGFTAAGVGLKCTFHGLKFLACINTCNTGSFQSASRAIPVVLLKGRQR